MGMPAVVYGMFRLIFGNGLISETAEFLRDMVEAMNNLFPANGSDIMNVSMDMFATLAAALLVIFYFIDLGSKASRETLTLQTLTLSFIRLMVAFALVVYSKEITINLCNLSSNIFYMVAEETTGKSVTKTSKVEYKDSEKNETKYGVTFWGMDELPKYTETVKGGISVHQEKEVTEIEFVDDGNTDTVNSVKAPIDGKKKTTVVKEDGTFDTMEQVFTDSKLGIFPDTFFKTKGFLKAVPYAMFFLLPALISMLAIGAAYLFAVKNTLEIVVYALFMPLAVTQAFDDVQKSNAIRYIKKFFALTLNYMAILVVLYGVSKIQVSILPDLFSKLSGGVTEINSYNFNSLLDFKLLIVISAVQFAAIAAIAGVNRFTSDLWGVR